MVDDLAVHNVFVGNVGEDDFNTLVVRGAELAVPLELDVDADPLQDDEVRLRAHTGAVLATIRISDEAAELDLDQRMVTYRFSDVPYGVYALEVRVGGAWVTVLHGLLVDRAGVHVGDRTLSTDPPDITIAEEEPREEPDPVLEGAVPDGVMDLNLAYTEHRE